MVVKTQIKSVMALLLVTAAAFLALASMPGQGPLGPGTADAATRQWWGIKFDRWETNVIANASIPNAKSVLGRGLPAAVVNTLVFSYREAARWSLWQGRCLGVTWVGSQVPGVRC